MTSTSDAKRRLLAILSADAAGYSRLMARDEPGTVATLNASRARFRATVAHHGGRVVDTAGDSVLAVFESVVEAVQAAVQIQDALQADNAARPAAQAMLFRIGVNLGDVLEQADGTVYGDGVNIAARLQALAEPGGISVSGTVVDHIGDKLAHVFEPTGLQQVKNISQPVRTFRVAAGGGGPAYPWNQAAPSDPPAVAVLPFRNLSGDPEQSYFSDGITEDIIVELSRFRGIAVIGRNSSFEYKDADPVETGRKLGVHYVLAGSVRRAGDRVRICAELYDAEHSRQLWAERFDREVSDVFAVQDEIARTLCATLARRVECAELEHAKRKPPSSMAAYDYLLRGKDLHHRRTREDNSKALRMFDSAITLDPEFAQAFAWRACTLGQAWLRGYTDGDAGLLARIEQDARRALALDEEDHECHRLLAELALPARRYDEAMEHHERAAALNPNDPAVVCQRGELETWLGNPAEGVEWIEKAMRLDPHHLARAKSLGVALYGAARYAEAAAAFRRSPAPDDYRYHTWLAVTLARAGDAPGATRHAKTVRRLCPGFIPDRFVNAHPYRNDADRARLRDGLVQAGLSGPP